MARWSDLAEWVGPTPNQGGSMFEYRGMVLHIAQGTYAGTIAWQRNPAADVSSHFIVAKDGRCAQMVDTAVAAWTQAAGNGRWISVEFEGFAGESLTPQQVEDAAQLYARGVLEHGWPLQATDSPSGLGLGWHGMGGTAWGGHFGCPGDPIKAQRPDILARTAQILGQQPAPPQEEEMSVKLIAPDAGYGAKGVYKVYPTPLGMALEKLDGELGAAVALWGQEVHVQNARLFGTPIEELRAEWERLAKLGAGPTTVTVTPGPMTLTGTITPKA